MSTQTESRIGRPTDQAKRDAIVAAASDAFFDVGYAATSIEGVAAKAGVSKVTIYNQFKDKRGLFVASVERECEKMRGHFSIEAASGTSIRDRLTVIGEAMFAFLSRPEMIQFERRIAAETENEPAIGEAFLEAGPWRMKAAFALFLSAAEAQGELEVPEPGLAAEQFVSMCKGMGDLERRFGTLPTPDQTRRRIQGAVDVFLKAYAPTDRID
ncbi:TetR/AcrR family transcriptional regulator [Parerythrobacter jejuensis]|uniref:TetR family transcriptional regulator n=1 Tax=Parerythrobacter jejuensis TaxID=795812 RepID=A0A845APW6_9SPHN|nr:TetR/AcrR family transcriptional regulator [Parerythrobacter jejuensis]MXP30536.1 TetR family transcriptional regulator [Parerythrobacter jejuensis]MXP33296.1 TetR family transcriptional regulator [Parerythrobacter jejuensis]